MLFSRGLEKLIRSYLRPHLIILIKVKMQNFSWYSIAIFCVFNLFVESQWQSSKKFQGASTSYGVALKIFASIGKLIEIAYLLYYGWAVVWWAPIAIYFIALMTSPLRFFAGSLGVIAINTIGFIAWPVCAYFMFIYVLTPPI